MIGLFDSGVGGLSILLAVRTELPGVPLLYVADTAWFPYGARTPDELIERTATISEWLIGQGARVIVVACNTATNAAIVALRGRFTVPFVGVEPAVKVAADSGRAGRIGVLCTPVTAQGERYHHLVERVAGGREVVTVASEVLAGLVEHGGDRQAEGREVVARELQPLLDAQVETIVLGCTHYAFLAPLIRELAGCPVLEPAAAVARQVRRIHAGFMAPQPGSPPDRILLRTTGDLDALRRFGLEHGLGAAEYMKLEFSL